MKGNDSTRDYLQQSSRRYILSLSAGVLATGLAGCTGSESNDTEPATTDGPNSGAGEAETSAGGSQLEEFDASEIRIGEESQRVQVDLSGAERGDEVDVYVDFTSLTEAGVGIQDLSVVAETSLGSYGWLVSDAEITEINGIVVRVRVEVEDVEEVEDFAAVNIDVTDLNTEEAEQMEGLEHSATISTSNGEPDFTAGETATYDVIDPEEIENVLQVQPSDIRVGETSQQVKTAIQRSSAEIEFRMDLRPLSEVGVSVENAEAVVNGTDGIEDVEITITDGVVQSSISTTDDDIGDAILVEIQITGLDTGEAEATSELTYPVYTGERPPETTESEPFSISGAVA